MATTSTSVWESLDTRRSTAFRVGGAMFAVSAVLSVVGMVTGAVERSMIVGEAFIAAGWIAGLVGLLGLYPAVRERSPRVAKAGVVSAVVGLVTFAALAVASLVAATTGGQISDLPVPVVVFLPGVFVGSFLAFVSFSVATFRSETASETLAGLLLVPTLIFLTNLFVLPLVTGPPPNPPEVGAAVTTALALAMLAIGYRIRAVGDGTSRQESVSDAALE